MDKKYYYFGKFEDDGKAKTLSFRVSKETHDLFETHANANYKDKSNALKDIFLEYMSQFAFRRQTIKQCVKLFIPFCKDEGDLEKHKFLPHDSQLHYEYGIDDLLDVNNVIAKRWMIDDFRSWDLDNEIYKDSYNRLKHWIYKESSYDLEDGFVVNFPVNNQLDRYTNGIYSITPKDDLEGGHEGLMIVEYEGFVYYVRFFFRINPEKIYFPFEFGYPLLITNKVAYDLAMECGNLELAKLIDSFNEGTSNIEHDKQLLLEKRENLLSQIREIDDKLSKYS